MRALRIASVPILLAILVAASLGGSVRGDFVWDDRPLIVDNPKVRDAERIPELLTSSFWNTGDRHDRFRRFFRPVTSLTYALDHAAWSLRPAGYHLTNLLLHLACCLLVFALARREELVLPAAFAGAALFAVHPVHVESVAWISGRTDVLAAAFALGALLLAGVGRGARGGPLRTAGACVLFAVSLFAKEMTATLPALVLLERVARDDGRLAARVRAGLASALPFAVTLAAVLAIRRAILGGTPASLLSLDPIAHAATAVWVLARYLVLLLLPRGLDAHYPDPPLDGVWSAPFLSALLVLLAAGWVLLVLAHRDRRGAFWLGWIFVSLTPVLTFGSFGDVLLADRFLYFPSVGLALLVARGAAALPRLLPSPAPRRAVAVAAVGALLALGLVAHRRVAVWHDDLTLFETMARTSPGSGLVRNNLGLALYHSGDVGRAEAEFRQAVALVPTYALAQNNLAAALERRGDLRGALAHYARALELAPGLLETRVNVARLRVLTGHVERGLAELKAITADHPTYVPGLSAHAAALAVVGQAEAALSIARRARELDPDHAASHYVIGSIHHAAGRRDEAVRSMTRFLELWEPDDLYRRAATEVIDFSLAPAAPSP